jgi:hypothetical protein
MPFKSKAQMRAAFGGYLGRTMKSKADTWAQETPNIKDLPEHARAAKHNRALIEALRKHKGG